MAIRNMALISDCILIVLPLHNVSLINPRACLGNVPLDGETRLSDEEWAMIELLLSKKGRGPARKDDRRVLNVIFCTWAPATDRFFEIL